MRRARPLLVQHLGRRVPRRRLGSCPYDTLGINPTATRAEAKEAYLRLAKQHHPDRSGDPTRFRAIAEAWEIIGDKAKRASGRRAERKPPSAVAPVLETIGSTRVLAAAAGCLVLAEVCRIAFGEDAVAVEPVRHLVPPEREPTRTPLAPAFSSTAGLPYEGHSKEVIGAKVAAGLEKAAARRRERVAEPPVATRSDLRRPAPMARKERLSRSVK